MTPGASVPLDQALLESFPEGYRHLAYLQSKIGYPVIIKAVAGGGGRGNVADALPEARRAEYQRRMSEIDAKWPAAGRANVKDFVDHIDYLVKKIGVDHVGISSDFDGGGGVDGFNSAAEAFNVTLELVRRGYTEQQIGKMWSGNLLRVWGQVEAVAKQIQGK